METTELLKKVRQIEIKTRGLSNNIFAGQYHSAFKGRGMAFSEVRELWTNELVKVDGSLPYSVPEKDVRVYRFKKTGGSGVKDMENEAMARTKVVPLGGKRLMVYSGKDMNRIEVYDMQGRLNGTRDLSGRTQVELDLPHFNGMALVRIHYADGTKEVCKTLVY